MTQGRRPHPGQSRPRPAAARPGHPPRRGRVVNSRRGASLLRLRVGFILIANSAEEFQKMYLDGFAVYGRIVKQAGIQPSD